MERCNRNWVYGLLLGLSFSLSSCGLVDLIQSQSDSTDDSAVTSTTQNPSASPEQGGAAPQSTESPNPFTVLTAPQILQPASSSPVRENYACLTTNYFADLVWQDNQPTMTLGRKSAEPAFRNLATAVKANADGSFTYEVSQNTLYYTRIYPDRTCLIQVVDPASGTATIEESGSLGELVIAQ